LLLRIERGLRTKGRDTSAPSAVAWGGGKAMAQEERVEPVEQQLARLARGNL
jgi:hypothetical protein